MDESKKDDFKVYVQSIIKIALPNLGKGGYFFSTRGRKSDKKTEKTIARNFLELIITRDTYTTLNSIDTIIQIDYTDENGRPDFYTINALDKLTNLVIIIFRRLRYGTQINRSQIRGRRIIPIFNLLLEPEPIVANDQRTQQEADEENEENKKEYTEYLKLLLENQNLLDSNIIYIQHNNIVYQVPGGLYVPIPQNINEIERRSRILTNIIFYITRYMNQAGMNITGNAYAAIQNLIDTTEENIRVETDSIFGVVRTETQTRRVKSARTNIVVNLEAAPPAPILPIEEEEQEEIKIVGTIDENELTEQIVNQAVNDANMDRVTDLMLQIVPVQREEVKLEEPEIEEPPIRILADIKGGDLPIVPSLDRDMQNIFQKLEDEQNQNQPNQNEINRLRNLMRNFNRRIILQNFNLFMNEEIMPFFKNAIRNLSMMNRGPQNLIHRDNVQAVLGGEQPNIPEIINVANEYRGQLIQYLNGQFGININDRLVYSIGQCFLLSIYASILTALGITYNSVYDYIHIPPESKLVEQRVQEENNGSLLFASYETILDAANNLFSQFIIGDDVFEYDEEIINPYIPRTTTIIDQPTIIDEPIISDIEIIDKPFIVDSRPRGLSYIANDAQIYINGKWYASKVDYLIPDPIIIDEKKEESQLAIIETYEKPKFDFDRTLYKEIFEQSKLLFGMPNAIYYEPKQLINFFTNQEISFLSELITGDLEPKDIIKETIKIFKKPENIKLLKEYVFSIPDYKSGGGPPGDPDDDPDDNNGDFGDKIPDDDEVDYFINTANGFIYIITSLTYFLMVPFKLIGIVGSVFATFKLILFMTIAILLIFFAYQISGLTIPEFISAAFNLFLGTVQTVYDFGSAVVDGYKFVQSYLSVIPGGSYILPIIALLGIGYIVFSSSKISTIKFSLL